MGSDTMNTICIYKQMTSRWRCMKSECCGCDPSKECYCPPLPDSIRYMRPDFTNETGDDYPN